MSSVVASDRSAITGPVRLSLRRVYILPTAPGMLFAMTLAVMLLGAINYNNSLAHALTFLIASLMMITIVHTYRNLAGISLGAAPAEPVFAGDDAQFPLTIDNRGGRPRYALELRTHDGATRLLDIDEDRLQSLEFRVPTSRRGVLKLERIRITSTFPLGLFRAWSYYRTHQQCIVYPQPAGHLPLPPLSPHNAEDQSGHLGGAEDFIGFRGYHPGDSIRSIAWKAVARGQDILVKRFSGSGSQELSLHWRDTHALGDTESRLSQLCLWVLEAEQYGLRYSLTLPGLELPLGNGSEHRHRCLEALALFSP